MSHSSSVRRAGLALSALALGLVASACSHSASVSTTTNSGSNSGTSSTTNSSTSSSSTTTALQDCSTGVLHASAAPGGNSAGTSSFTFTLTNTGPDSCRLSGFPSIQFFGPSGAGGAGAGPKLAITVTGTNENAPIVRLDHGASTKFSLYVHEVPLNGIGCSVVASVEVFPPSSTEALSIPLQLNACGGSATVGPIGEPVS